MSRLGDYSLHYISLHLPRKPYDLVSGITKKSLQPRDGGTGRVKVSIFLSVSGSSFNASCIHELKRARSPGVIPCMTGVIVLPFSGRNL